MIIHDVEQGTYEWHCARAGVPTASELSKILTPKGLKPSESCTPYAYQCAAGRILGHTDGLFMGNDWTDRGHELEPDAIKLYEFTYGVKVDKAVFVTSNDRTAGCSPDGLIPERKAGLEIKCLNMGLHLKILEEDEMPMTHTMQVQGSLFVTGYDYWDFMAFHPELRPMIKRITPIPRYQDAIGEALFQFEANVLQIMERYKNGE